MNVINHRKLCIFVYLQLPKAEVLDTMEIVALYRYNYPVDNFNGNFDQAEDLLEVQIGSNFRSPSPGVK